MTMHAMAPMRNLSRIRPDTPAVIAPKSTALLRVAFFFPAPGRRLIPIMAGGSAFYCARWSCDLPERQTDRQHQQRSDLVRHERLERTLTHFEIGKRIRLLHREAKPRGEHLIEAGNARAAAAGE